ncbi:hypothetical protein O181_126601, partial [Austropuccinia psidii MF-1]|nr:hypothetical protein [Austropuccinia psidii MF-1]
MVHGPWGLLEAPGPHCAGDPGIPWDQKMAHGPKISPTWPGPIEEVQDHQDPGLPKIAGEALVMSSKPTELTESSPSAAPPSVLCGSGVFSRLSSPSMASSAHFDPSQIYDGYRACHYCFIGKKPCRRTGMSSSNVRRYLWSRKDGPFGKEFPVFETPTPDGISRFPQ